MARKKAVQEQASPAAAETISVPLAAISMVGRHGTTAMVCIAAYFIADRFVDGFEAYAGKQSSANLNFSFAAHIEVLLVCSVAAAISGFSLYVYERRQHKLTRERLSEENRQLEIRIDPERSSSMLTTKGETRKEDR